jgi:DNA helicase-2/ATP-dependent DNA helicase PcrA
MAVDFLRDLNKVQQEAVTNINGPALVIAGAGSGKTRVLTYRIAWLLKNGVPASEILALTFTNKAAGEMKERISALAGHQEAKYLWMGTFHSIFARILRQESDRLGYPRNFTIYDTTDSKSLIRNIIRELNLDDKLYKPGSVMARISTAKNNLITVSDYNGNQAIEEKDRSSKLAEMGRIYKIYAARCLKAGAMDFDDLLLNTNILFRDFPDVLEHYRNRFRYILVDEYQDTNYAQYLIVKKLSLSHRNLCVVGDDAQSIYSFRGARIENILNFRNDYPDYRLFKLEQNYRSTKTIVEAANSIIKKNREQITKHIFSEKEKGVLIKIIESMTDTEEGIRIVNDIYDLGLSSQVKWEEIAILYRTNAQSRVFEESFRKRNIPYKIYGGVSFYDRKEIKDIIAYFRMVINPSDEEALRRVINYPKRGIGKTTVDRLFEVANQNELPVWNILNNPSSFQGVLTGAVWKRIAPFTVLINSLIARRDTINAYELARTVTAEAGIGRDLSAGQTPEEISRYENFEELLNAIKEFTEEAQTNGEPDTLDAWLETVALLTDQDNEDSEDRNHISLMTAHSAKGLEFKHIYIVGLEENLFPSIMSSGSDREIEEERRLFYVAVTRAMERVTLSYARNRYKWGNLESCRPSRFIDEIDARYLEYPDTPAANESKVPGFTGKRVTEVKSSWAKNSSNAGSVNSPKAPPAGRGAKYPEGKKLLRVRGKTNIGESSNDIPASGAGGDGELKVGAAVVHDRFGRGLVTAIEGNPPNTTATVDFREHGSKKLLLRFAKLRIE